MTIRANSFFSEIEKIAKAQQAASFFSKMTPVGAGAGVGAGLGAIGTSPSGPQEGTGGYLARLGTNIAVGAGLGAMGGGALQSAGIKSMKDVKKGLTNMGLMADNRSAVQKGVDSVSDFARNNPLGAGAVGGIVTLGGLLGGKKALQKFAPDIADKIADINIGALATGSAEAKKAVDDLIGAVRSGADEKVMGPILERVRKLAGQVDEAAGGGFSQAKSKVENVGQAAQDFINKNFGGVLGRGSNLDDQVIRSQQGLDDLAGEIQKATDELANLNSQRAAYEGMESGFDAAQMRNITNELNKTQRSLQRKQAKFSQLQSEFDQLNQKKSQYDEIVKKIQNGTPLNQAETEMVANVPYINNKVQQAQGAAAAEARLAENQAQRQAAIERQQLQRMQNLESQGAASISKQEADEVVQGIANKINQGAETGNPYNLSAFEKEVLKRNDVDIRAFGNLLSPQAKNVTDVPASAINPASGPGLGAAIENANPLNPNAVGGATDPGIMTRVRNLNPFRSKAPALENNPENVKALTEKLRSGQQLSKPEFDLLNSLRPDQRAAMREGNIAAGDRRAFENAPTELMDNTGARQQRARMAGDDSSIYRDDSSLFTPTGFTSQDSIPFGNSSAFRSNPFDADDASSMARRSGVRDSNITNRTGQGFTDESSAIQGGADSTMFLPGMGRQGTQSNASQALARNMENNTQVAATDKSRAEAVDRFLRPKGNRGPEGVNERIRSDDLKKLLKGKDNINNVLAGELAEQRSRSGMSVVVEVPDGQGGKINRVISENTALRGEDELGNKLNSIVVKQAIMKRNRAIEQVAKADDDILAAIQAPATKRTGPNTGNPELDRRTNSIYATKNRLNYVITNLQAGERLGKGRLTAEAIEKVAEEERMKKLARMFLSRY